MIHKHTAVAGSFDHFHAGHRFLLTEVFTHSDKISLAITDEEMSKGKILGARIQPFETRKNVVETFLKEQSWSEKVEISTLKDIYGVAIVDKTIEAIYTTPDTVKNAEKINEIRAEKKMKPLEIITLPLLEGDDDMPISSSRIRLGEIDRNGRSYLKPFMDKEEYTAPLLVRDELRSPIGDVIQGPQDNHEQAAIEAKKRLDEVQPVLVITVGDIVTKALQTQRKEPHISFIDNRSRREELDIEHKAHEKHGPFKNKAGTIESKIVRTYATVVQEAVHLKEHVQFIIEGEEDLLGLPAIMLAPLGAVVLHGQFEEGIVYVPVTEEIKRICYEMLLRFE